MKQHETAEIRKAFAFEETDDNAHLSSKLGIQRYVMMADQIKKILGDGRILDWGCGAGQMSYLLKNRGLDVTSCDIRSGNRPLLEGIGQSVQQLTDQVKLPFTDASFDAVLSSGVLEHVNDQFASLKEISRILKDGGYFFVYMLPNRYSYVEFISDLLGRGDHPVKYSLKEIRGIVEQTGFEVSRMGYQNFFPYNLKGFPKILRKIYHSFDGLIEKLDSLFIFLPLIRRLSTNLVVVARKK